MARRGVERFSAFALCFEALSLVFVSLSHSPRTSASVHLHGEEGREDMSREAGAGELSEGEGGGTTWASQTRLTGLPCQPRVPGLGVVGSQGWKRASEMQSLCNATTSRKGRWELGKERGAGLRQTRLWGSPSPEPCTREKLFLLLWAAGLGPLREAGRAGAKVLPTAAAPPLLRATKASPLLPPPPHWVQLPRPQLFLHWRHLLATWPSGTT